MGPRSWTSQLQAEVSRGIYTGFKRLQSRRTSDTVIQTENVLWWWCCRDSIALLFLTSDAFPLLSLSGIKKGRRKTPKYTLVNRSHMWPRQHPHVVWGIWSHCVLGAFTLVLASPLHAPKTSLYLISFILHSCRRLQFQIKCTAEGNKFNNPLKSENIELKMSADFSVGSCVKVQRRNSKNPPETWSLENICSVPFDHGKHLNKKAATHLANSGPENK